MGPFNEDEWYTMGQLKLDLAYTRKNLKKDKDYPIVERYTRDKLKEYLTKVS